MELYTFIYIDESDILFSRLLLQYSGLLLRLKYNDFIKNT